MSTLNKILLIKGTGICQDTNLLHHNNNALLVLEITAIVRVSLDSQYSVQFCLES